MSTFVGGRPVADSRVLLGRQVRPEIVEHERQSNLGWVEAAYVATELEELGAGLVVLDVHEHSVAHQIECAEAVPHAAVAVERCPHPARCWAGASLAPCPLPSRMRLQIERPELVDADHNIWITSPTPAFPVGEEVQIQHPILLGFVVRVGGFLPRLYALKPDPRLRTASGTACARGARPAVR